MTMGTGIFIEKGEFMTVGTKQIADRYTSLMSGSINRGRVLVAPWNPTKTSIIQTSCVNCGAPLKRSICEYCC